MRALKKPSLRPVKRCGDGRIRRPSRRREGPGLPRAEVEGEANSPEPDETNDETGNGRVRVPSSLLQLQSLDAQGYTPAFYPRKSDLLKTWVGGGLNKSRRPGAAGLFRPSGRLLGARVTFSELWSRHITPCQC